MISELSNPTVPQRIQKLPPDVKSSQVPLRFVKLVHLCALKIGFFQGQAASHSAGEEGALIGRVAGPERGW